MTNNVKNPIKLNINQEHLSILAEILPTIAFYRKAEKIKTQAEKDKKQLFEILGTYKELDIDDFHVSLDLPEIEAEIEFSKAKNYSFKSVSDIEEELKKNEEQRKQLLINLADAKEGAAIIKQAPRQKVFEISSNAKK